MFFSQILVIRLPTAHRISPGRIKGSDALPIPCRPTIATRGYPKLSNSGAEG